MVINDKLVMTDKMYAKLVREIETKFRAIENQPEEVIGSIMAEIVILESRLEVLEEELTAKLN